MPWSKELPEDVFLHKKIQRLFVPGKIYTSEVSEVLVADWESVTCYSCYINAFVLSVILLGMMFVPFAHTQQIHSREK